MEATDFFNGLDYSLLHRIQDTEYWIVDSLKDIGNVAIGLILADIKVLSCLTICNYYAKRVEKIRIQ